MGSIGLVAFIFSLIVKNIIKNYGAKTMGLTNKTFGKLLDVLNSTKEIIMFKKSDIFIKQYKNLEFKNLNVIRNAGIIQKIPKFFFLKF